MEAEMKGSLPYWYRPRPSAIWRWVLYANEPDVRCLRRWLLWVWWSRPRTPLQRLRAMWDLALRPVMCGKAALFAVAAYGERVRRIHGIGIPRQVLDVLGQVFGAGLDPVTYYQYQLFLRSRRGRRREYLDVSGKLLQVLAQRLPKGPDDGIFTDKVAFASWCRTWGLPVVGDHALIDPMAADPKSGFIPFPAEDLVVKPINWRAGEGISLWRCSLQGNEPVWEDGNGGKRLDARALWAHLQQSAVAMRRPLLVQSRLVNHPAIRELGNGCLCSVRVMTVREGGQRPQVIATALRIPMGQCAADNFDQGGGGCGGGSPDRAMRPGCAEDGGISLAPLGV
ncbi:sugar-transfer associated ATP-grasp domain-containing protein [Ectothiorhodospira mobilis]|uniref:sugar-transfer associated ATP-grasp domain-containing protein n=1 Tax=Ectothiorhodospira mobilis TaxID=195064 RepID=UPI00237806A1|nr:sugar-transfer associated ATP-grasp domain-containing protein [Ectothiorhodospira mobilis]